MGGLIQNNKRAMKLGPDIRAGILQVINKEEVIKKEDESTLGNGFERHGNV